MFIAERQVGPLRVQPVVRVTEPATFETDRPLDWVRTFEMQHWGATEALVRDPDGREISLQGRSDD